MSKRIPTTLEKAIQAIILDNTLENLLIFSSQTENDVIALYHYGVGLNIRNSWGLWKQGSKKGKLLKYFNSIGITHPDDMSGIIFITLHRKLNKKEIKVTEQVKYYQNYWKKLGCKDGRP